MKNNKFNSQVRKNTNIIYVHSDDKNNAIDCIKNSYACYFIVNDDDFDLYEFIELIENYFYDFHNENCNCDDATVFYLSNESIVEKSLEIQVDMIDEFTHIMYDDYDDSLNICTIDEFNYALDNEIERVFREIRKRLLESNVLSHDERIELLNAMK